MKYRSNQLINSTLLVVSLLFSLPSNTLAIDNTPSVDYVVSIMEELEMIPVLINGNMVAMRCIIGD